jgi:hypothetical protein
MVCAGAGFAPGAAAEQSGVLPTEQRWVKLPWKVTSIECKALAFFKKHVTSIKHKALVYFENTIGALGFFTKSNLNIA